MLFKLKSLWIKYEMTLQRPKCIKNHTFDVIKMREMKGEVREKKEMDNPHFLWCHMGDFLHTLVLSMTYFIIKQDTVLKYFFEFFKRPKLAPDVSYQLHKLWILIILVHLCLKNAKKHPLLLCCTMFLNYIFYLLDSLANSF